MKSKLHVCHSGAPVHSEELFVKNRDQSDQEQNFDPPQPQVIKPWTEEDSQG